MVDAVEVLTANLEVLRRVSAGCTLPTEPGAGWRIDRSGSWPVLLIEGQPGRWLALNDQQAPLDEARDALDRKRAGRPWPAVVVLLGAGLGYAIDVVERDAPPATRVLVVEPFGASAAALLARRDWHTMLETGRLRLVIGPGYAGAADAWRMLDPGGAPPLILPHYALVASRPQDMLGARHVFDRIFFDANANAEARRTLGGRYLVNTLKNVPRLVRSPDLRAWIGSRTGRPAVICGAGPSLNRNLRTLAARRDRVVLVAADTALRPILEAGLEPDFVVAVDPTALNARHVSGLPGLRRTWLVCEASVDETAFDSFGDRVMFYRVGSNDPWPWLASCEVSLPVLAAWGSVLTSAFDFTTWLGCNPIAFMGADLSYTEGQPYCRGTMFEADWARIVLEGQPLPTFWGRVIAKTTRARVGDVNGADVETAPHLLAFRDWLVDRAAGSGTRIVNLSGSGVLAGVGIEQQRDAAWLDQLPATIVERKDVPGSVRLCVDVAKLSAAAARLTADTEPMAGWIAGCSPNLDRAALDAALSMIQVGRDRATFQTVAGSPARGLTALPEAVAIVHAAREGRPLPSWATESSAWSHRTGRPRIPVDVALQTLLSSDRLTAGGASPPTARVAGHLHDLFALNWPQHTFEAATALTIETASILAATSPAGRLRQRTIQVSPDSGLAVRNTERRARLFATSLWATAARASTCDADGGWRRLLDLLDSALDSLEQPRQAGGSYAAMTVSTAQVKRSWRVGFPLSADQRAETLSGALFRENPARRATVTCDWSADGIRVVFDSRTANGAGRDFLGRVPHRVLSDQGLPKCLIANPLGPDHAIVTPRGQHASFLVDSKGGFERAPEWQQPITGEIQGPLGAIAWTHSTPAAMLFRQGSTGVVMEERVSFQPYSAVWWGDTVLVTGDIGVWSWRPGHRPTHLAKLPPGVIVGERDGVLSVDPLPLVNGRLERIKLASGWDVVVATGAVRERPLGTAGQAWCRASGELAVATSYPESDAVGLSLGSASDTIWLAWPRPRTPVWLDSSLLLNTGRGEVVLFPDLVAVLRRHLK